VKLVAGANISNSPLVTAGVLNTFPLLATILDTEDYVAIAKSPKVKAKKAVGAIAAGAAIYYVTANNNVAGAGDVLIGFANEAALSADTHVKIRFNGELAFAKL
jgi:hypothetical protein